VSSEESVLSDLNTTHHARIERNTPAKKHQERTPK
jgi:hypothetical protein